MLLGIFVKFRSLVWVFSSTTGVVKPIGLIGLGVMPTAL